MKRKHEWVNQPGDSSPEWTPYRVFHRTPVRRLSSVPAFRPHGKALPAAAEERSGPTRAFQNDAQDRPATARVPRLEAPRRCITATLATCNSSSFCAGRPARAATECPHSVQRGEMRICCFSRDGGWCFRRLEGFRCPAAWKTFGGSTIAAAEWAGM